MFCLLSRFGSSSFVFWETLKWFLSSFLSSSPLISIIGFSRRAFTARYSPIKYIDIRIRIHIRALGRSVHSVILSRRGINMQDMLVSSRADFESLPPAVQRKVCILLFRLYFSLPFHLFFRCPVVVFLRSHMTGRNMESLRRAE